MDVIEKLSKYGLTIEKYEELLKDISDKKMGLNDLDWQEICDKYNLTISHDTLRKSNDFISGGYFVNEYYKLKQGTDTFKSSMLNDVRDAVGELDIKKQEVQTKTRQLTKIKRDLIKSVEIANDIKDEMYSNGFKVDIPSYCYSPLMSYGNGKAIVHITDWHLGLVINNCKYNSFNLEIAKARVKQLYDEVRKFCEFYDVEDLVVVSTGDMIEHCYMRNNQHQNVEFNQSVQINECINLIYTFLINLCEFANVEFYGISGNHDRTVGDKNVNTNGDNANTIITEQLYNYNEIAKNKNKRLTIHKLEHDAKEIIVNIDGFVCKFIHGDERIKDGKRLIENDFSMDDCAYNILFRGHWHNFNMTSENNGRYIVNTGCLSGYNDYSVKFGCTTRASQTLAIVIDGKLEIIKDVILD